MNDKIVRPYKQKRIDELESITGDNCDNASVLIEVFMELEFRRPRKRPSELRRRILNRLSELSAEFFRWPTTLAPSGDNILTTLGWPRKGLLSYLGYHVGKTGPPTTTRREILDEAYNNTLPTVNNTVYMADWGAPRSGPRLEKIAESIAAFCRNRKRKDGLLQSVAIADWESDLAYLKSKYYDGVYDFHWPRT
jgi:hypothetical protein